MALVVRTGVVGYPLLWAAANRHQAVVRLLLEKGAELESKDKQGCTPLSSTAAGGHEAVAKQLLARSGVDANSKT